MVVPDWIWVTFIFAFGCCIGSFLNVVIYRLPRDKSLVSPGSACPACGEYIAFYDNIPLLSWLLLLGRCRHCKASISPRYFIIELLTGLMFIGLFFVYFRTEIRAGLGPFLEGGWFIYLLHIAMLAAFIAASAIDLELWVIPISICWFVTAIGIFGSAVASFIIDPAAIEGYALLPSASANTAALAGGALIGLAVSFILLATGLIKRSYESEHMQDLPDQTDESAESSINHRLEVLREILFLLPIVVCSIAAVLLIRKNPSIYTWWVDLVQKPVIAGFFGSLWGYFVGCGVVWATRIFGTLAFGREAMGLGDVHLMGAAGAVVGPVFVTIAFFVAPFFGLSWAGMQMFFKKIRQIPYGPFLSLGVLTVMILHDRILRYLIEIFYY